MINSVFGTSSPAGPTFSGDVFLSIYSQANAGTGGIPTAFDTSGVDAIVAAYRGDSSAASQPSPQETSSLTVAADALKQVQDLAFQMQDLAYASSDPFASDGLRRSLQAGIESLTAQIQNIAATTSYNGEKLFDGTSFRVQVGGGIDASIQAGGIDLQGLAINLKSVDVSTLESSFKAMDTLNQFSDLLVKQATRSLDSAEARMFTVRQSFESLLSPSGGGLVPSATNVGGSGVAQMILSYQGSAMSQADESSLVALIA